MRRLVVDLSQRLGSLEAQVADLGDQLEKAETAHAVLQAEDQDLRNEIARLKNLPPRPPFKPSGMDKVTEREVRKSGSPRRRRGPKRDKDRVTREEVLSVNVPSGSRFKGYEAILVRELAISSELVRYRRERWLTPEGKTIIAPLPDGLLGGFGANLSRFCLVLHAQGQVTTERLTTVLNGIGMDISKRQVVRILTSGLENFAAEDQAILRAGLATAPYISVDDTGARHARRDGVTTQIGGSRFSVFRTGRSKSRLNFLSLLRAGCEDYIINDAALDYMRHRKVAPDVISKLAAHPETFPMRLLLGALLLVACLSVPTIAPAQNTNAAAFRAANDRVVTLHQGSAHVMAIRLAEQILETAERVLGPEYPDTLVILNNLAFLYQSQGRYGEAEPLYRLALKAARERVLGPEHPDTLSSVNNLAFHYESQGQTYGAIDPVGPLPMDRANNIARGSFLDADIRCCRSPKGNDCRQLKAFYCDERKAHWHRRVDYTH